MSCDALCADWRIYQRERGHRFSTDDLYTAWYAAETRPQARRVLDLGTGIGSVAMMLAYQLPGATIDGIEAQTESLALLRRSLAHNQLEGRVRPRHGDLRALEAIEPLAYELVSGTPPYIPPGRGRLPADAQKAHCRFELRGGIEDYARAAARALGPGGAFVFCFDARFAARAEGACTAAGLTVRARREVVPRTGRSPLFSLFRAEREPGPFAVEPPLYVRGSDGRRTDEAKAIRRRLGMPPTD